MLRPAPLAGLLLALVLAACDPPADPEGTTAEVQDGRLVLGWVAGVPQRDAPEIEVVRRLAASLSAELEIVEAPVHELVGALEVSRIHLMAGDLPETSPLSRLVGLSRPVGNLTYRGEIVPRVIALREGENGFLVRLNRVIEDRP